MNIVKPTKVITNINCANVNLVCERHEYIANNTLSDNGYLQFLIDLRKKGIDINSFTVIDSDLKEWSQETIKKVFDKNDRLFCAFINRYNKQVKIFYKIEKDGLLK